MGEKFNTALTEQQLEKLSQALSHATAQETLTAAKSILQHISEVRRDDPIKAITLKSIHVRALILITKCHFFLAEPKEALTTVEYAASITDSSLDTCLVAQVKKHHALALHANSLIIEAGTAFVAYIHLRKPVSPTEDYEDFISASQICAAASLKVQATNFATKAFDIALSAFGRHDKRTGFALFFLARCAQDIGEVVRAEECIRKHLGFLQERNELDSAEAGAGFYVLAKILREQGKNAEALDNYQRSIQAHYTEERPAIAQIAMAYNDVGLLFLGSNDAAAAIQQFNTAISLLDKIASSDPVGFSSYFANRGRAYARLQMRSEARADWQTALRIREYYLNPGNKLIADIQKLLEKSKL